MPVTKTAKRALRVTKRKTAVNSKIRSDIESSLRVAKRSKKQADIKRAVSLLDRAAKKNLIHKNKASRLKSQISSK